MHVRDARADEAEQISAVAREAWHAAYGEFLPGGAIDATVDEWYDPAGLHDRIADDETVVVVAVESAGNAGEERGGDGREPEMVGFGQARYSDSVGNVVLDRIYALPDCWGTGVGSAMLGELARRFVDDHDSLSAVVLADNAVGRAFYGARGFSVVGEQTTTFSGVERDELVVRADLEDLAAVADVGGE